MRPIVAVAPSVDEGEGDTRFRLRRAHVAALELADLLPVVIPPLLSPDAAAEVLDSVSGLVLTGGTDIDPSLYGAQRGDRTEKPSTLRDEWEIALIAAARERGMPTLAICRGMQIMNVAHGGTLLQDIADERPGSLPHGREAERNLRVHEVEIHPGTRLADALGTQKLYVNSLHHQAAREVPLRLSISALAPDGIVEGLEWPNSDWWMVAVQWHPEDLVTDPEPWDRNLYRAFAGAVRRWEEE